MRSRALAEMLRCCTCARALLFPTSGCRQLALRRALSSATGGTQDSTSSPIPDVNTVLPDVNDPSQHPLVNLPVEEASTEKKFWQYRAAQKEAPFYERIVDKDGRAYGTGKRKTSVASVWIEQGDGNITINGRHFVDYFEREALRSEVIRPLVLVGKIGDMDVRSRIEGGGIRGQAEAMRHGIAKALLRWDPELRKIMKKDGLLTRDARIVEPKKYGKKKARKSFQWVKR